ncbi:hypothetical protein F4821DRAFT_261976 [Hypoxylon rubiginosum]|uniref:Uncharacterized protein n=1 Tax=Hypoxylon rubiginosum TaxID=110542 RepID=A0ACC0CVW7_9PEZI|nr:hypothetical protein F4821DRAFT_261976 [Hypoxylon rubiginosum]
MASQWKRLPSHSVNEVRLLALVTAYILGLSVSDQHIDRLPRRVRTPVQLLLHPPSATAQQLPRPPPANPQQPPPPLLAIGYSDFVDPTTSTSVVFEIWCRLPGSVSIRKSLEYNSQPSTMPISLTSACPLYLILGCFDHTLSVSRNHPQLQDASQRRTHQSRRAQFKQAKTKRVQPLSWIQTCNSPTTNATTAGNRLATIIGSRSVRLSL